MSSRSRLIFLGGAPPEGRSVYYNSVYLTHHLWPLPQPVGLAHELRVQIKLCYFVWCTCPCITCLSVCPQVHAQGTCATQGTGLYEGLDWLSNELSKR